MRKFHLFTFKIVTCNLKSLLCFDSINISRNDVIRIFCSIIKCRELQVFQYLDIDVDSYMEREVKIEEDWFKSLRKNLNWFFFIHFWSLPDVRYQKDKAASSDLAPLRSKNCLHRQELDSLNPWVHISAQSSSGGHDKNPNCLPFQINSLTHMIFLKSFKNFRLHHRKPQLTLTTF